VKKKKHEKVWMYRYNSRLSGSAVMSSVVWLLKLLPLQPVPIKTNIWKFDWWGCTRLNLTICWLMTYWRSISTTIKQWQPWIVDIKIKCLDCYTFLSIKQDIDQVLYVDLYWIRRNYRRDYCHVRNVSVKLR
jgi:hypothetical protein